MERYALRVRDYVRSVPWNEAWELIRPLLHDPYSHVTASLRGHMRPASPVEEMAVWQIEAYAASKRKRNSVAQERLSRPWEAKRDDPNGPRRSASDRAEGRRQLQERLGIK